MYVLFRADFVCTGLSSGVLNGLSLNGANEHYFVFVYVPFDSALCLAQGIRTLLCSFCSVRTDKNKLDFEF